MRLTPAGTGGMQTSVVTMQVLSTFCYKGPQKGDPQAFSALFLRFVVFSCLDGSLWIAENCYHQSEMTTIQIVRVPVGFQNIVNQNKKQYNLRILGPSTCLILVLSTSIFQGKPWIFRYIRPQRGLL
jgi:hypothetical protein